MTGWRARTAVVAGLLAISFGMPTARAAESSPLLLPFTESSVQGRVCLGGTTAADLDRLFDTEPAGLVGADYQRAHALPDGRVFWTFQDGAVRLESGAIAIVHSIGMLQDGPCFTVLYGGTRSAPEPFLFADETEQFHRWFWPLDAEMGSDGMLYVFAVEMLEESDGYLIRTVPQSTRVAVVDPATGAVVEQARPADSSASLYGWSIASDDRWTYLYAQCYRQFGFDTYALVAAFDSACSPRVTVARVPRGRLLDQPSYWNGSSWQADARAAVPVIETAGRRINADQFVWTGGSFVSVNKEGDWWGDTIYFSRSARASGPFVIYGSIPAPPKCADCNTFFASWLPESAAERPPSTMVIGLSHNRWDGLISAVYRPTFHVVAAPPFLSAGRPLALSVPDGADLSAAVMNVTAVYPDAPGHVTVFPCDRDRPLASNLNHAGFEVVANLTVVRPDADGRVCLFSLAATDLVADLGGGFLPGSGFEPVDNPFRLVDTRTTLGAPDGRLAAGETIRVRVPDRTVEAAVLNVTAVSPASPGYLTAFPCDRERPLASNLNYVRSDVVANLVVVRPDAAGDVCLFSLAETDLVVDLAGGFDQGSGYDTVDTPVRLVDTRIGLGAVQRPLRPRETLELMVPGGVGAAAAVLNITAVQPSAPGYVTAYPCDRDRPVASNVNFDRLDIVANLVIVRPDAGGRVCLFTLVETDLVVDLAGTIAADSGYGALDNPSRILDTRDGTGIAR